MDLEKKIEISQGTVFACGFLLTLLVFALSNFYATKAEAQQIAEKEAQACRVAMGEHFIMINTELQDIKKDVKYLIKVVK